MKKIVRMVSDFITWILVAAVVGYLVLFINRTRIICREIRLYGTNQSIQEVYALLIPTPIMMI